MDEKEKRIETMKRHAFNFIDRNSEEIRKIGDALFYFAELGMQEFKTSEYSTAALREMGFDIQMGIAGMPPAWIATWGSGKPVISVVCEGDALPNSSQLSGVAEEKPIVEGAPGHVEGHNTNMAVTIGGVVAAKNVMEREKIQGMIKVYFGPAEEQLISRPYILRDGYFEGVDAFFHPHVESEFSTTYGIRHYANIAAEFMFHGKSAASSLSPWLGRNALDAVVMMDVAWGLMRQQLEPSQSSHRVIRAGGDQPNVIPKYTMAEWWFREKSMDRANANFEKAKKIAEGAAIMMGCTTDLNILSTCWPTRANRGMAEIIQRNLEIVGMPLWSEEDESLAKKVQEKIETPIIGLPKEIKPLKESKQSSACNDLGCVSWVIPSGRISFPANIPGCQNHSWPAGISLATPIAHKAEVNGAKVLAASMLDLFADEKALLNVKESFREEIGDTKFFEILPEGQKPPVDLNRETMEKWRPAMEKFYIKEHVKWNT